MDIESIRENLKSPEALTPRNVMDMTLYLSSEFGTLTEALLTTTGEANEIEANLLQLPEMTSSKAKVIANASNAGKNRMIVSGRLKAIEQMIQALKKAQSYFSEHKY